MASTRNHTAPRLRRIVQTASLLAFVFLLWQTARPLAETLPPVDIFLRLDPLAAVTIPVAAREWIATLAPGVIVIAASFVVGRLFCGWICPMGATLDVSRALARRAKRLPSPTPLSGARHIKTALLAGCLAAAALGVTVSHWLSPMPLVTRLYVLVLHPALLWAAGKALLLVQPFTDGLGMESLAYLEIPARSYATALAVAVFFLLLFLLERVRPRFWCRYLCPAGAILALCSLRPLWKREVSRCIECGACARTCPTGCLAPDGTIASHAECIACQTCVGTCPVNGVAFRFALRPSGHAPVSPSRHLPSRRSLLAGLAGGGALAALQLTGAYPAVAKSAACIRPPGSFPETGFLDRCLRCGQCMKACPTNALQPAWFAAGIEGMFTPVLVARHGVCEPECNACGSVCPTGAIHHLNMEEKYQAKIGTAVVDRKRCVAWAEGRQCVVCEEVCPYASINITRAPGFDVVGPVVDASRCFGCGYCERFCPTAEPSIVVRPFGALRLTSPTFREAAAKAGLAIMPASRQVGKGHAEPEKLPPDALPPGFTD